MKVLKYRLSRVQADSIMIRRNARLLCVKVQNNEPMLYVLVHSGSFDGLRKIVAYETGEEGASGDYIGTAILDDGRYVVHFFDQGEII